ncbi:uncharacterized protein LOC129616707 isoform X2 [Condylostylus longicornis]|uniref:uncharacterized protein LOC129616707 isoform X2 n=1 Tax=Condylostylus longicornis TaxID=2530218 RepID=UPI00244DEEEB|nr:uncharacterized protein LOC129616707 isoform X2 [Condylostylus longicornis]
MNRTQRMAALILVLLLKSRRNMGYKKFRKLRRKTKADRPVKLQKSTLELYDSDSEAQRAKRPRMDEEVERSEDESIESIESSSDSESSDESCYSSLISNSESNSTHSESFITETDEDFDNEDIITDNDVEALEPHHVKPEVFDDPLATINYEEEDRKPDLDELTEALRNADNENFLHRSSSTINNGGTNENSSSIRIKEEPRY